MIPLALWTSISILLIIAVLSGTTSAAVKPPPPTISNMETILLERYVLLKDWNKQPSPELVEVVRDISRRRSTGCKTTAHYEMETELFRHILKASSYLYAMDLIDPLVYLNRNCSNTSANNAKSTERTEL